MAVDVLILGGGLSSRMMAKRLSIEAPHMSVEIVGDELDSVHPFHLHRPILEIPALSEIKPQKLVTNVYDGTTTNPLPTVKDSNDYSVKVFGRIQVTNLYAQESISIYPVSKENCKRAFDVPGVSFTKGSVESVDTIGKACNVGSPYRYLISTIPLPDFLKCANVPCGGLEFRSYPFWTARFDFGYSTNMYQMVYNTDLFCEITRVTLLDSELFLEAKSSELTRNDAVFLERVYRTNPAGLTFKCLPIGRFDPLPISSLKSLFHYMTQKFDVFFLGRYGTWTFRVANDVWEDTLRIVRWVKEKEMANSWEGR